MKVITVLSSLLLLLIGITDVSAVTCANGVYRAGCAGPNGAVGVRKQPAVVVTPKPVVVAPKAVVVTPSTRVVKPAANCAWINGRKVCR